MHDALCLAHEPVRLLHTQCGRGSRCACIPDAGRTCSKPNMANAAGSSQAASARLPSARVAASASSAAAHPATPRMPPDSSTCAAGAAA